MAFKKGRKKTGGKKKGSKNKETLEREALRDFLIQEVIKEKVPLIKALIAKGKTGEIQALKEIFDRVLGKSKESLDLTSGGEPLGVGFLPMRKQDENNQLEEPKQ